MFHVEHSGEDSYQVFHVEHCLVFAQVVGYYPMRCDLDAKSPTYVGVGPVMQFLTDRKRLSVLLPSHLLLFGDRLLTQLTLVV
jgi:hypothetical protein